jgi:hypothetical protein
MQTTNRSCAFGGIGSTYRFGFAIAACHFSFWLLLREIGYPASFRDDMFYTGAALEIARSGDLVNPWLQGQFPGLTKFLVYPPFYSEILGGWLAIFGGGLGSLTWFWTFCASVSSFTLASILRQLLGVSLLNPISMLLLFPPLAYIGFRPEILGYPFWLTGAWLLFRKGRMDRAVGLTMLGSSVLTAPQFLGPAFLVGVVWLCIHRLKRRLLLTTVLDGTVIGLILLCAAVIMVDGQWLKTLQAIQMHSRRHELLGSMPPIVGAYWVFLIAACAIFLALHLYLREEIGRPLVLLLVSTAALPFLAFAHLRHEFLAFSRPATLILVALCTRDLVVARCSSRAGRLLSSLVVAAPIAVLLGLNILVGSHLHNFEVSNERRAVLAQVVDRKRNDLSQSTLFIDSTVARQVYHFNTPPKTRDWAFAETFPYETPTFPLHLDKGSIWFVSQYFLMDWLQFSLRTSPNENVVNFAKYHLPFDRAVYGLPFGLTDVGTFQSRLFKELMKLIGYSGEPWFFPKKLVPVCIVTQETLKGETEIEKVAARLLNSCDRPNEIVSLD